MQGAAGAVEFVRPAFVVFGLAEVRQHGEVIPVFAAALLPVVAVGRVAPHVDHAIDRASAAQNLASWLDYTAAVQVRLRLALRHPLTRGSTSVFA